jgi:pyruvate ferredoxin oxidoreductase beta subunit/2-oxoisovalerate ferredoxin oxidoreductase beta subunit
VTTIKDLPEEDLFTSGHTACPGCGGAMVVRAAMKVLGPNTVAYMPASCLLVFSNMYPLNAFRVPTLHVLFETSAICAAAVRRALRRRGRDDVTVVAFAGDGGTADIGLQALSGAAERNEDILYICYDNEAYMNTGIQRSGATPFGAWTTTTPIGAAREGHGKLEPKKDVARILMAHDVPYLATASLGFPADFLRKLGKAKAKRGFRYLHVLAPCPVGWRAESDSTVDLAKLAVETGLFTLLEYEDGVFRISREPRFLPVREYLSKQGRFQHLTDRQIAAIEAGIRAKWDRDRALAIALGPKPRGPSGAREATAAEAVERPRADAAP